MFIQKVSDLFEKAVEMVKAFYNSPDVHNAIDQIKQTAADVVAWIREQVKERPEAAMAGAIVAWVTLTVISTFTMGLMLTVLFTCAVAAGAHHYFTS
jgi:hypothetical protein